MQQQAPAVRAGSDTMRLSVAIKQSRDKIEQDRETLDCMTVLCEGHLL